MSQNLITVEAAGRALGLSRSIVWRLIRRGELPSIRRGGRRLAPVDATRRPARHPRAEDVPALTDDHPIFRLVRAGRRGGNALGARDKHGIFDR